MSVNGMRDGLFLGNQQAYDTFGNTAVFAGTLFAAPASAASFGAVGAPRIGYAADMFSQNLSAMAYSSGVGILGEAGGYYAARAFGAPEGTAQIIGAGAGIAAGGASMPKAFSKFMNYAKITEAEASPVLQMSEKPLFRYSNPAPPGIKRFSPLNELTADINMQNTKAVQLYRESKPYTFGSPNAYKWMHNAGELDGMISKDLAGDLKINLEINLRKAGLTGVMGTYNLTHALLRITMPVEVRSHAQNGASKIQKTRGNSAAAVAIDRNQPRDRATSAECVRLYVPMTHELC